MIRHLYIKDFILIEELSLDLQSGFTTITGETGAGKSILIGAIGLILGNRADSKSVREGCDKAIIEATFDTHKVIGLRDLFEHFDLDYAEECLIRREVTATGKSRAFINDTPVTASQLREIGERLMDIHSQHHNMLIGDPLFQMNVIDTLAQNKSLLENYQQCYREYKSQKSALEQERKRLAALQNDLEYMTFQYQQLHDADLVPGEDKEIEERLSMARHSQDITTVLSGIAGLTMDQGETPCAGDQIACLTKALSRVSDYFPAGAKMYERLEALKIELFDLSADADDRLSEMTVDEQEIEAMEQRIDLIQGLLFKHKVQSVSELIEIRNRLEEDIARIDQGDHYLSELEKHLNISYQKAIQEAELLSASRREAAETILPELHLLMSELGIAGASFAVQLTPLAEIGEQGQDSIAFLFATNKKLQLSPIRDIASGGEISRFMLALKTILSSRTTLPTVIFDEIDTGVSGEVAEKLGRVMARLGQHLQVLTITHLPQIAALASHHLVVEKHESPSGYTTHIIEVQGEERVRRIAAMLTGAKLTQEALNNAKALLKGVGNSPNQ